MLVSETVLTLHNSFPPARMRRVIVKYFLPPLGGTIGNSPRLHMAIIRTGCSFITVQSFDQLFMDFVHKLIKRFWTKFEVDTLKFEDKIAFGEM